MFVILRNFHKYLSKHSEIDIENYAAWINLRKVFLKEPGSVRFKNYERNVDRILIQFSERVVEDIEKATLGKNMCIF